MSPTSPPKLAAPPIAPHRSLPKADAAPAAAATAKPSPARPSNPALLAHGGSSSFGSDAGVTGFRRGGRVGPEANAGASASAKTAGVQQLSQKELDKVFTDGAKVYEGILKTLGVTELPKTEDPAKRFAEVSKTLSSVLQSNPELGSQITASQFAETDALQKILLALQPQVEASGNVDNITAMRAGLSASYDVMAFAGGGGAGGGDHEPPGYFG